MNGLLTLILSQLMLGTVSVFAKWTGMDASTIVFFRCFFAFTSISIFVLYKDSILKYLKPGKTLGLLLATGFFMATNWLFFFKAVLTTTITHSILVYNFAPLFVILSAVIFLKESPTVRQVLCIGSSLIGVYLIITGKSGGAAGNVFMGGMYAMIAGALYAQVTIIGRYLKEIPAQVITFFQTSVGAVIFLPLSYDSWQMSDLSGTNLALLIALGVFNTSIPYLMYFKALKEVKASVAGILQYIYTLSSIVFGVIFFKESFTLEILLGGGLILISSYIAIKHPGKKKISFKSHQTPMAVKGAQA